MDLDDLLAALHPLDGQALRAALERVLGVDIRGLLLYGSRARGEETASSDWDLLAVTEAPSEGVRRSWRGVDLDIDARIADALAPSAALVYLLPGRVLYDADGGLARLLEALETLHAAGPAQLGEAERARWDAWVRRMLARIDTNLVDDEVLAGWQMSWLHQELLGLWFVLRSEWQRGPKRDMQRLREEAPEVWRAHGAVARAVTLQARREALGDLALRTVF